jgi:glutathione S-transferase
MKLHWSPRSPFVRKVMIVAHERGLAERLTRVRSVAIRTDPNPALMADNPLNKIPTMVLEDGTVLQDSRVICEYLDSLGAAPPLFPPSGPPRWTALRRQAFGDGLLDLLLAWRGERDRPVELHYEIYVAALALKAHAALDRLEDEAAGPVRGAIDVGDVAIYCALAYLDFRFADLDWRAGRPRLAAWAASLDGRPSIAATAIVNDESRPLQPNEAGA